MRVPLTRARALAVFAIAFGVLGALVIAPGFAEAEEPPVPPPPDYEYDVLPGSISDQPGLTAIELAGALERDELKAVWIAATDPVASFPNAERVRAALQHPKAAESRPLATPRQPRSV